MSAPASPRPRLWTPEELVGQREQAIEGFVQWWREEGNVAYRRHFELALEAVGALFRRSDDLRSFGARHLAEGDRAARDVARYLAGPPLSEDDLEVLAGPGEEEGDPDLPEYGASLLDWLLPPGEEAGWAAPAAPARPRSSDRSLAAVIAGVLDPLRFPWLAHEPRPRRPTKLEREVALRWTAGLVAAQKAATERRTAASRRQEQAVEDILAAPPLRFSKIAPRTIATVRDFLAPGEFCRQSSVGGTRADFSIGLRDRLLVIECKVSNSEVNSYKRLNHEVGNKAASWTRTFGQGVIPAAVLDGVFKLENLLSAQRAGIAIYWERDLRPFAEFIQAAT